MSDKQEEHIFELTAKTFHGLEKILASELKKIGASEITILKRAVSFKGNLKVIYKANYLLRTALNVLLKIDSFKAQSSDILYEKAKKISWEKFLTLKETFVISNTVHSSFHKHSHFAGLKVKDAIVDYFTDKYKERPSVDTKNPDKKIHLHIKGDYCTLSIDTSGEALFKRGYRGDTDIAPLNEILAAGMVMMSDYKEIEYFYDPMCGSGTILIEAARIFMNIPSGFLRKKFGFQKFADYDYKVWNSIKREAEKQIKKEIPFKIIGTDINDKAITIARRNISNAGLRHFINIQTKDFINSRFEDKKGLIITNPPYDIRIKSNNINKLYKETGDTLKQGFKGWTGYIFSGNPEAVKHIGLKPSQKINLYNGKIECKLLKYEIY
ncbi:MAG: class I SAM-dependent RNA methyltransferase [Bacteroidales bacterium]|nr:class I SAM-dependent RNA methyltransferase [Bacteroidales bacterium]